MVELINHSLNTFQKRQLILLKGVQFFARDIRSQNLF